MNPNFGSGLQEYLFEQNLQDSPDIVKQIITDEINNYVPGVTVNNVDIGISNQEKNELTDSYILYIKIQFTVNNQTDTLNLTVNQNNI
jgi:phage baseplate assembly protein W